MKHSNHYIRADIMLIVGSDEQFYTTVKFNLSPDIIAEYDGDIPVIDVGRLRKHAETILPSLKRKQYNIYPQYV